VFYYGTLGYTETDGHLSAQVRHRLIDRETAIEELLQGRRDIIEGREGIHALMDTLGVGHLKGKMDEFCKNSPFLNVVR
jgi:hypothetical protein